MKPEPAPPQARLLTDEQAADYIGASKSYVRALIDRGVLKRVELPTTEPTPGRARLLRLDVRGVDAWIDSLTRQ